MGAFWSSDAKEQVDMEGPLAKDMKAVVESNPVVIITKGYCPFCTTAKELFNKLGKQYFELDLTKRSDGSAIQDIMQAWTGARSVPRVFINGECIGGCSDMEKLYESGELENMLANL